MHLLLLFLLFLGQPVASTTNAGNLPERLDSLTVMVFLQPDCVISRYFIPDLNRMAAQFADDHIGFVGLFPNPGISSGILDDFKNDLDIRFPLVIDTGAEEARRLGVSITPEVIVIDNRAAQILYKGRIDDSFVRVGKRKQHIQSRDLETKLKAWVNSPDSVFYTETKAIGCLINFMVHPNQ